MPWILRGLRDGVVTSRWPGHRDGYFDEFPAAVSVRPDDGSEIREAAAAAVADVHRLCPTEAISLVDGRVALDRGRCVHCRRCVAAFPQLFAWTPGSGTSTLTRDAQVVDDVPETGEALTAVRTALAARVHRLRRSVHIRHVDTGSDGSDEWEVQALLNPVYDVHRLGVFFTASPRHADILLVTGIGTAGMLAALRRTREAMPDPVVVIAAGVDAISGGLIGSGYTTGTGVGDAVPVDVWVPGAPASPFSLLHAILLALGRVPAGREQ